MVLSSTLDLDLAVFFSLTPPTPPPAPIKKFLELYLIFRQKYFKHLKMYV